VPCGLEPANELFALAILILQNKYFGPFPEAFFRLLDNEGAAVLRYALDQSGEETQLFSKADSGTIDPKDKEFICYLMRPDPRDRPSAIEALKHPWLEGVS
jgi:serine/threonine protein kinase